MRLRWMVQILSRKDIPCLFTGTDSPLMKSAVKEASVILGPVPLPTTGVHLFQPPLTRYGTLCPSFLPYARTVSFWRKSPGSCKEFCDNNDILWKDFMDMEEISLENAIATAEAPSLWQSASAPSISIAAAA